MGGGQQGLPSDSAPACIQVPVADCIAGQPFDTVPVNMPWSSPITLERESEGRPWDALAFAFGDDPFGEAMSHYQIRSACGDPRNLRDRNGEPRERPCRIPKPRHIDSKYSAAARDEALVAVQMIIRCPHGQPEHAPPDSSQSLPDRGAHRSYDVVYSTPRRWLDSVNIISMPLLAVPFCLTPSLIS